MDRMCPGCSTAFVADHGNRLYCTSSCRSRFHKRHPPSTPCSICGEPVNLWPGRTVSAGPVAHRACKGVAHGTKRRYRSGCRCDPCTEGNNREQRKFTAAYKAKHGYSYRERFDKAYPPYELTEAKRAAWAARRARIVGATVESFTYFEIFARDNWVCGICGRLVQQGLKYPDPGSATLDHVVPLVAGGDHSRANTQLAHLRCNLQKGARIAA